MIAAVLRELNAPLELSEVDVCPPGLGQVKVRMLAAGICGSQLSEIRGEKGNAGHLPHLLGHEGCGIVVQVGEGVTKVRPGDKVVIHWRKGCGIESAFPKYVYNNRTITSGKAVTFAEQVLVSENRLTPVSAELDPLVGALFGCGFSTAMATLEHEADLKAGERLAIFGAGGIGANLIKAAQLKHACAITCCDTLETKRKFVEGLGGRFACEKIERQARGSFDVVVDTVGSSSSFAAAMEALAPTGRLIVVGQTPADLVLQNSAALFAGEGQTIKATQGGGFQPDRDLPRWVRLYENGQLDLSEVMTHILPFARINDGLDIVRRGESGRVLLTFRD